MQITNKEYQRLTEKKSHGSPSYLTIPKAFVIGGLICALGQFFTGIYRDAGMSVTDAGALTSMTLIFITALLTGLKVFDKIAKHAGAGTLVPITGFANSVVSPALEFKTEGYVMGLGAKMFIISGPVIVYGLTASVFYGILLYCFK